MDFIICLGLILLTAGCYFGHKKLHKYLDDEFASNPVVPYPNGDGKSVRLVLVNACGTVLRGCYREAEVGGRYSYVAYLTVVVIGVPILAMKCYRVIPAEDSEGVYIIGSERFDFREIACMLLYFFQWPLGVGSLVAAFVALGGSF